MVGRLSGTMFRRLLKLAFIVLALGLFLGMLVNVEWREFDQVLANAFAVLFGIVGAAFSATIARSVVKIPAPSKKLLIIVSVSCAAGGIAFALISGFVLRILFAIGLLIGMLGAIGGLAAFVFGTAGSFFAMWDKVSYMVAHTSDEELKRMVRTGTAPEEFRHGAGRRMFEEELKRQSGIDYNDAKRGE